MKILIQFPTRSRPVKSLEVARKYAAMLSGMHQVTLRFTLDDSDPSVNDGFLGACRSIDSECKSAGAGFEGSFGVSVIIGSHQTKVQAVNDIPRDGWDVCLVGSDDMIPQVKGFDDVIATEMRTRYPDLDGSLWFNDGYVEKRLNTIVCIGRKYYHRFGYIYHPIYESMWCDNEFTEVGTILNRQAYIDRVIIKHEHPANNASVLKDDLYIRNDEPWQRDYRKYLVRQSKSFRLPLLDILICTLASRKHKFDRVYGNLMHQIDRAGLEQNVHVLKDDTPEISIGAKRNRLVGVSRAEYVCFVDDDDNVSQDYVQRIVTAIGNCDVDAIGIRGSIKMPAAIWRRFEHDLKHKEYTSCPDGIMYYRPPNHLNPIRRSIVQRYPFINESHGEDSDFALRMCRDGAIGSCRMAAEHPLYYYVPSGLQNAAEVPSTSGAELAPSESGSVNRPALPGNMKTSTWRREGPRRPRRR